MKTFDNEWIVQTFEDHPSFFTKRMFGGLAVYLFGRQMMVLVEPTKTGRWQWHGVLICTDHAHHRAIIAEFPQLAPHDVLKKWLYIDSQHADFEPALERVAKAIARDDPRFGIHPRTRRHKSVRTGRAPRPIASLTPPVNRSTRFGSGVCEPAAGAYASAGRQRSRCERLAHRHQYRRPWPSPC